jgi:hypothetical protein
MSPPRKNNDEIMTATIEYHASENPNLLSRYVSPNEDQNTNMSVTMKSPCFGKLEPDKICDTV